MKRERKKKKVICREIPRQRIRLPNIEIEGRREDFKVVKIRDTHTYAVYAHTHKHTQANTQNHSHTKFVAHTHTYSQSKSVTFPHSTN